MSLNVIHYNKIYIFYRFFRKAKINYLLYEKKIIIFNVKQRTKSNFKKFSFYYLFLIRH